MTDWRANLSENTWAYPLTLQMENCKIIQNFFFRVDKMKEKGYLANILVLCLGVCSDMFAFQSGSQKGSQSLVSFTPVDELWLSSWWRPEGKEVGESPPSILKCTQEAQGSSWCPSPTHVYSFHSLRALRKSRQGEDGAQDSFSHIRATLVLQFCRFPLRVSESERENRISISSFKLLPTPVSLPS